MSELQGTVEEGESGDDYRGNRGASFKIDKANPRVELVVERLA